VRSTGGDVDFVSEPRDVGIHRVDWTKLSPLGRRRRNDIVILNIEYVYAIACGAVEI
jgi:hypothetical protein